MTHEKIQTMWRENAACRTGVDPELFFPVAHENTRTFKRQAAEALAVCARCPVWRECREDAINTAAGGIRGRTTEGQRNQLIKVPVRQAVGHR